MASIIKITYRSKEGSVEGNLLSSVRRREYDVVNFIIQAPGWTQKDSYDTKKPTAYLAPVE